MALMHCKGFNGSKTLDHPGSMAMMEVWCTSQGFAVVGVVCHRAWERLLVGSPPHKKGKSWSKALWCYIVYVKVVFIVVASGSMNVRVAFMNARYLIISSNIPMHIGAQFLNSW